MNLATTLAALAAGLGDIRVVMSGGTTTWSHANQPFAVLQASTVELRLDRAIAAAALKTPDTSPSRRGPEWVRYEPASLEGYDRDRLEAWFGLAFRRAAAAQPGT